MIHEGFYLGKVKNLYTLTEASTKPGFSKISRRLTQTHALATTSAVISNLIGKAHTISRAMRRDGERQRSGAIRR
jgi:hypothetical protein